MSASMVPPSKLRCWASDEQGFTAAEKAIAIAVALALILMVTRIILNGSEVGAMTAQRTLAGQSAGVPFGDTTDSSEGAGSGSTDGAGASSSGGGDDSGGFWSTVADVTHVVLGVGSLIPVVGTVCAVIDAGIYTVQGDYVNAGISVISAIPIGGDIAAGTRLGVKAVETGVEIEQSINAVDKTVEVVQEGSHIVQATKAESEGAELAAATEKTDHFSGTEKPWTKGATPNSTYSHIDPKTGKVVQNAIYDAEGNVIGHVDFKNHGAGAPSGHGHTFPEPGNPSSGHGAGKPHIPGDELPPDWSKLPPGTEPHTPLGN